MNEETTWKGVSRTLAACWREATGLVAIKLVIVFLASTYRDAHTLPPEKLRVLLERYFDVDAAVFLSGLPPVFLFLVLGTILTLPFVVVTFAAFGLTTLAGRATARSDFLVIGAATLAVEVVAGTASSGLAFALLPGLGMPAILERQLQISAIALAASLPAMGLMTLFGSLTRRPFALFFLGVTAILALRHVGRVLTSESVVFRLSQRGIESLLLTGEADRFAAGVAAGGALCALFVLLAWRASRRTAWGGFGRGALSRAEPARS